MPFESGGERKRGHWRVQRLPAHDEALKSALPVKEPKDEIRPSEDSAYVEADPGGGAFRSRRGWGQDVVCFRRNQQGTGFGHKLKQPPACVPFYGYAFGPSGFPAGCGIYPASEVGVRAVAPLELVRLKNAVPYFLSMCYDGTCMAIGAFGMCWRRKWQLGVRWCPVRRLPMVPMALSFCGTGAFASATVLERNPLVLGRGVRSFAVGLRAYMICA